MTTQALKIEKLYLLGIYSKIIYRCTIKEICLTWSQIYEDYTCISFL